MTPTILVQASHFEKCIHKKRKTHNRTGHENTEGE
jgi:hypothetical protein